MCASAGHSLTSQILESDWAQTPRSLFHNDFHAVLSFSQSYRQNPSSTEILLQQNVSLSTVETVTYL